MTWTGGSLARYKAFLWARNQFRDWNAICRIEIRACRAYLLDVGLEELVRDLEAREDGDMTDQIIRGGGRL